MRFFLKYKVLGIFLIACSGQFCVKAQSVKDTLQLKEVEFSYKKKKQEKEILNTVKLDSVLLAENPSLNLAEIINRNTTAFIKTYSLGGISTPSIRGTAANHTKIYWNNIPINSSSLGTMDLSLVPVFLLDDIELQYSSAGLQQSSGSLGAGINLSTLSPSKKTNQIFLQQSAGSFGTYKTFLGGNYGYGKFAGSTKLYYQRAKNNYTFRNTSLLNSPLQEQRNAGFEQKGLMQQAAYKINAGHELNFTYWYQTTQRDVPQQMFILFDSAQQKDVSSRALLEYKFTAEKQEFSALAAYSVEELNFKNSLKAINALSKGNKIFTRLTYNRLITRNLTLFSQLNYNYDKVKIDDYKSDTTKAERTQEKSSVFTKLIYTLSDKSKFQLAARQELINADFMPATFTASFSAVLIKNEKLSFFSSAGRNFNFPSLNDLYWIPGGNPKLKPEKSWSADAGFSSRLKNKNQKELLTISVTGFSLWVNDWIQWQPGNAGYWESKNLKQVWSRGVEAKINTNIIKQGNKSLLVDFNYTFTRSSNISTHNPLDNSLNKQLIYIPLHIFRNAAKLKINSYFFNAEYNFNGFTYTNSDNTAYLPAYGLINLAAGKNFIFNRLGGVLIFNINNLMNTSYQAVAWYPMPGRYLEVTLKLNIK